MARACSNATTRTPSSGRWRPSIRSSVFGRLRDREEVEARRVLPLPDHHRALVLDHHLAGLVVAAREHLDDALLGPRCRLANLDDLALRVKGVAVEERIGQPDLVPAEGEPVLAH